MRLVRIAECVFSNQDAEPNFARQYVAMRLLLDTLDEGPPAIQQSMQERVTQAREHYTLTSGLKLTEIWHSMLAVNMISSSDDKGLEGKGLFSESTDNQSWEIVDHINAQVSLDNAVSLSDSIMQAGILELYTT